MRDHPAGPAWSGLDRGVLGPQAEPRGQRVVRERLEEPADHPRRDGASSGRRGDVESDCTIGARLDARASASANDVKAIALPVMRHRIGVNFRAEHDGIDASKLVAMLVESVTAP